MQQTMTVRMFKITRLGPTGELQITNDFKGSERHNTPFFTKREVDRFMSREQRHGRDTSRLHVRPVTVELLVDPR